MFNLYTTAPVLSMILQIPHYVKSEIRHFPLIIYPVFALNIVEL